MPNEPWLYGENYTVGPFTPTEASRRAASERLKELRAQPQPTRVDPQWQGFKNFLYDNLTREGSIRAQAEEAMKGQESVPNVAPGVTPPYAKPDAELSPVEVEAPWWQLPRIAPDLGDLFNFSDAESAEKNSGIAALPSYMVDPNVSVPDSGMVTPPAPPPAPEKTAPAVDPFQQALTLAKTLVPDYDASNPAQDKADAYAAQQARRTQLLAQLAFASGLTAAGGPGWEDVGKGFAAAATTYDKGYERYAKALQSSADRYAEEQQSRAALQAKRAGVAADLYSASQDQALAQFKLAHQLENDKNDFLYKQLGLLFPKPGDYALPEEKEKRQKAIETSLRAGQPVLYNYDLTK